MIVGFFGLPRSGKTYMMSYFGLRLLKRGYPVYSNYPLNGAYKLDFDDVVNGVAFKSNAVLLLTELHNYANSREWATLSPQLFFLFSQGGKMNLRLFYDAQDSSRVDKILRENTNYFYHISPLFPSDEMAYDSARRLPFIKRILVVDKYTNNYDLSFGRRDGSRRSFYVMSWSVMNDYDSFFFVREFNNAKKEVAVKWDL